MKSVFLKPATGCVVPNPDRGGFLAEQGEEIILTAYWQRRLNDGDVVQEKPIKTKGATK